MKRVTMAGSGDDGWVVELMSVPRFLAAMRPRRRSVVVVAAVLVLLSLTGGLAVTWASARAYDMANAPLAHVDRNGLRLTLRVGPGPYFLRELLPVSVSLTNISGMTVSVPGPFDGDRGINGCGSVFAVREIGGDGHSDLTPGYGPPTCPGSLSGPAGLAPGHSVSASGLLPIMASGRVTFTVSAPGGDMSLLGPGGDPSAWSWPQVQLTVSPTAPLQRTIWLTRIGTRVYVLAPPAAQSHLVYLYHAGSSVCYTGNFAWVPIKTLWVDEQPCGGKYGTWDYAVSAPGYTIARGSVGE